MDTKRKEKKKQKKKRKVVIVIVVLYILVIHITCPTDRVHHSKLTANYIYKAKLNGACYKHVFWQIDSSAVEKLTPLNDTTVSIKFKKTFKGYLYASVNSCMDVKDSIMISAFDTPVPNLGKDTSFCTGSRLYLNAKTGFQKYKWQDGSTDSFFVAVQTGKYFVEATDYCNTILYDTINITINKPTAINLGNDTSFCSGQSIVLNAGKNFVQYEWNTGATGQTITASAKGKYVVTVTNEFGCFSQDSISIINTFPLPVFSLNKKDVLCKDQNDTLFVGKGFATYLWQNGSTKSFFRVTAPGKFKIKVTNEYGCIALDSVEIKKIENAPASFLSNEMSICKDETVLLKTTFPFDTYLWSNGNANSFINASPGKYWLLVEDNNGCKGIDSITISSKDCNTTFFTPSSFTPNGDALNDIFKPVITGRIERYEFSIYNRWGQLVFKTNKINDGWDGLLKGQSQKTGSYAWYCIYKIKNEIEKVNKGAVTLLR